MINFINLINEEPIEFSDTINKIDLKNSIIICSRKAEQNLIFDKFWKPTFIATDNIAFTNYTTVNDFTVMEQSLRCKICYPKGIDIDFIEPFDHSFYNKIYNNFKLKELENNFILSEIRHVIYLDRVVFRILQRPLALKKGESLISLNFSYTLNSSCHISNIYYIKDDFMFDDFSKQMDR